MKKPPLKYVKTKVPKKYVRGVQQITPDMSDYNAAQQNQLAKEQLATQATSTAVNMAVPGAGSLLQGADALSTGLTKKDGEYKSDFAKSMDYALNPMAKIKALTSGNRGDILDSLTFGLGSDIGKRIGLKGKWTETSQDKKDEAEQKALREMRLNNYNNSISGYDPTTDQQLQAYKMGTKDMTNTKLVEVEKNELIMKKNAMGKYVLKADFVDGKPHSKGGEDYVAQEGDIIFPGKMRKKVMSAYKSGDNKSLESMRLKLPKDKPSKDSFVTGTDDVTTDNWEKPIYNDRQIRNSILMPKETSSDTVYGEGSNIVSPDSWLADDRYKKNTGIGNINSNIGSTNVIEGSLPNTPFATDMTGAEIASASKTFDLAGLGDSLATVGQYASTARNLYKGLSPAEEVTRRELKPDLLKYQDMSEPLRRKSRLARTGQISNARNLSGGSAGNLRANAAQAYADDISRQGDINQAEVGRADTINNMNSQIKNQTAGTNLNLQNQYDQMDAQNRATKEQYLNQFFADTTNASQVARQEKYSKSRDAKLDRAENVKMMLAGTKDYALSPEQTKQINAYMSGKSDVLPDFSNMFREKAMNTPKPETPIQKKKMGSKGIMKYKSGSKYIKTKNC